MIILIFKIIYYIGLAIFCIASLLALRQMNRFSYLGRAIRPIMVLYILVSLTFIVFIQIYMMDIDWDKPLFSRSIPNIPSYNAKHFKVLTESGSYKTLDTSVSKSSGGIVDFIKNLIKY